MSYHSVSHELVRVPNHNHKVDPRKNGSTSSREDKKDTFQHFLSMTLAAKTLAKSNKPSGRVRSSNEIIGEHDVLLGRTKEAHSNPGNHEFRRLVHCYRLDYQHARFRKEKNAITYQIIDKVTQLGGRFLKYCAASGTYEPISDADCYEKVSHALRSARAKKTIETTLLPSKTATNSEGETELIDTAVYPRPDHFHNLLEEQQRQFHLLNAAKAQRQVFPEQTSSAIIPHTSTPDLRNENCGSEPIVPPPPRLSLKYSLDPNELLGFLGADLLQNNDDGT